MYRSLVLGFSSTSYGRPSAVHRELFIQLPSIIADRVSITAAAIIGLVLLLFIYGREAAARTKRDVESRMAGDREKKRRAEREKKRALMRGDDWIRVQGKVDDDCQRTKS